MPSDIASIKFHDEGAGSNLVLVLPGCPCKPQHYAPLVTRLARKSRVLLAEFPGYAQFGIGEPSGIEEASRTIEQKVRTLGIQEFAVIGHSLGAYRALHLALSHEVKVRTVVTLGGFADLGDNRQQYLHLADMAESAIGELANAFSANALAPDFASANAARSADVRSYVSDMHPSTLAAQLRVVAQLADLRPALRTINARVVARHGSLDAVVPALSSQELVAHLPNARLELVARVGHFPLFENERETLEAVERALSAG